MIRTRDKTWITDIEEFIRRGRRIKGDRGEREDIHIAEFALDTAVPEVTFALMRIKEDRFEENG